MIVRLARPSDADLLVRMSAAMNAEDGHPHAAACESAARTLAEGCPWGTAWMLHEAEDGPVIGYFVLSWGFSIEHGGRDAMLDEIYLEPDWRGRGLGRTALAWAEAMALASGAAKLHLEVERGNPAAQRLYRSAGFAGNDRLLLTKTLSSSDES